MRLWGHGLTCLRGGRQIFAELDFSADAGEALAVTGRNGSGKSSLLRLIAGLLALEAGTVALDGGADDLTVAEQAHFLGHRDALKPSLTVAENLCFWRDFLEGDAVAAPVDACLEAVGIGPLTDLPASYLSAGQRRRLSLARLLAVKRPVWLLDEPGAALDVAGHAVLVDIMRGHLGDGGIIVAATHEPLGLEARELRIGGPA
jgi:heme exporter protein A